jgi:hypothetical protein
MICIQMSHTVHKLLDYAHIAGFEVLTVVITMIRAWSWPNWGTLQAFAWWDWEKPQGYSQGPYWDSIQDPPEDKSRALPPYQQEGMFLHDTGTHLYHNAQTPLWGENPILMRARTNTDTPNCSLS